jgi:hypothetical protein
MPLKQATRGGASTTHRGRLGAHQDNGEGPYLRSYGRDVAKDPEDFVDPADNASSTCHTGGNDAGADNSREQANTPARSQNNGLLFGTLPLGPPYEAACNARTAPFVPKGLRAQPMLMMHFVQPKYT